MLKFVKTNKFYVLSLQNLTESNTGTEAAPENVVD